MKIWTGVAVMSQTARQVLKLLKEHGFLEVRIIGDHHRFEDGNGHKVTVPYSSLKDEITPGTYNNILKQAGLK
jgi:predicted RNA binding protein YcfA (HicA-like mRNA interferase family)